MSRTPLTDRDREEIRAALASKEYRVIRNLVYSPDVFIAIDERSTYIIELLCDIVEHVPNRDLMDGDVRLCPNCRQRPTAPHAEYCEICSRQFTNEVSHSQR